MPHILINLPDWRTPEILARKDSIIAGISEAIFLLGDSTNIVNSVGLRPYPSIPGTDKQTKVAICIELSGHLIETGIVGTFSQETWIETSNPNTDVRIEAKDKTFQLLRRMIGDRAEILEKSAVILRGAQLKLNLTDDPSQPPTTRPSPQQLTCEPTCPTCGHTGIPDGPRAYRCRNCGESFGTA